MSSQQRQRLSLTFYREKGRFWGLEGIPFVVIHVVTFSIAAYHLGFFDNNTNNYLGISLEGVGRDKLSSSATPLTSIESMNFTNSTFIKKLAAEYSDLSKEYDETRLLRHVDTETELQTDSLEAHRHNSDSLDDDDDPEKLIAVYCQIICCVPFVIQAFLILMATWILNVKLFLRFEKIDNVTSKFESATHVLCERHVLCQKRFIGDVAEDGKSDKGNSPSTTTIRELVPLVDFIYSECGDLDIVGSHNLTKKPVEKIGDTEVVVPDVGSFDPKQPAINPSVCLHSNSDLFLQEIGTESVDTGNSDGTVENLPSTTVDNLKNNKMWFKASILKALIDFRFRLRTKLRRLLGIGTNGVGNPGNPGIGTNDGGNPGIGTSNGGNPRKREGIGHILDSPPVPRRWFSYLHYGLSDVVDAKTIVDKLFGSQYGSKRPVIFCGEGSMLEKRDEILKNTKSLNKVTIFEVGKKRYVVYSNQSSGGAIGWGSNMTSDIPIITSSDRSTQSNRSSNSNYSLIDITGLPKDSRVIEVRRLKLDFNNLFKEVGEEQYGLVSLYNVEKATSSNVEKENCRTKKLDFLLALYGKNCYVLPKNDIVMTTIENFLSPFFIFQLVCLLLWLLDDYWYYSLFTLCTLFLLEFQLAQRRVQNVDQLRAQMLFPVYKIWCYRGGKWGKVNSDQLLPGDIVGLRANERIKKNDENKQSKRMIIDPKMRRPKPDIAGKIPVPDIAEKIPCDILLLGEKTVCLCDESMLTGESVPQLKNGVSYSYDGSGSHGALTNGSRGNGALTNGGSSANGSSRSIEVGKQQSTEGNTTKEGTSPRRPRPIRDLYARELLSTFGYRHAQPSSLINVDSTHRGQVLFGGTSLLHVMGPQTGGHETKDSQRDQKNESVSDAKNVTPPQDSKDIAVGVVLRTGYDSKQGKLVRTIVSNAERVSITNSNKEIYWFLVILLGFAIFGAYLVAYDGFVSYPKQYQRIRGDIIKETIEEFRSTASIESTSTAMGSTAAMDSSSNASIFDKLLSQQHLQSFDTNLTAMHGLWQTSVRNANRKPHPMDGNVFGDIGFVVYDAIFGESVEEGKTTPKATGLPSLKELEEDTKDLDTKAKWKDTEESDPIQRRLVGDFSEEKSQFSLSQILEWLLESKLKLVGKPRSTWKIFLSIMHILTSVVPPEFPTTLSFVTTLFLIGLIQISIFCTEPDRFSFAGKVDVCCFDKTGTLTSAEYSVEAVVGCENAENVRTVSEKDGQIDKSKSEDGRSKSKDEKNASKKDKDSSTLSLELDSRSFDPYYSDIVIGSCHSLVKVDSSGPAGSSAGGSSGNSAGPGDGMLGNPMEKAAFLHNKWAFSSMNQDSWNPTVVKFDQNWSLRIKILKRFLFSSELQRMSCIVKVEGQPGGPTGKKPKVEYLVVMKGSSERIKERLAVTCDSKDFLKAYNSTSRKFARKGLRVIALSYRRVEESELKALMGSREECESNHVFAGFLALRSHVKSNTEKAMKELRNSGHKVVMITGDSPLTACHVAKETKMTDFKENMILCQQEGLQKSEQMMMEVSLSQHLVWENMKEKTEKSDDKTDNSILSLADAASLSATYCLCIPGSVLPKISDIELDMLVNHTTVFARITPEGKKRIIESYRRIGFTTLMIGDGINDVGALKKADVGISILSSDTQSNNNAKEGSKDAKAGSTGSKNSRNDPRSLDPNAEPDMMAATAQPGEASIASPFTYRGESIKCVPQLLRAGRGAVCVTLQMYVIMAVNSIVLACALSLASLDGTRTGDLQAVVDSIFTCGMFFQISRSPVTKILTRNKPISSVFHPVVLSSMLIQVATHVHVATCALSLTHAYRPRNWSRPKQEEEFSPNLAGTVLFLITQVMHCSNFLASYEGSPFLIPFFENKPLTKFWAANMLFTMVLVTELFPPLNYLLGLIEFPDENIQFDIIKLMVLDLVVPVVGVWLLKEIYNRVTTRKSS